MRACRAEASKTETQTTDPTISSEMQSDYREKKWLHLILHMQPALRQTLENAIDSDIFYTFTVQYISKYQENKGIEKKKDL